MSCSVDERLLPSYVNLSTNFREPPFRMKMSHFLRKPMYFTWKPMPPAACSRLCSRDSAWVSVFTWLCMPSAISASVIISAWYHLLFAYFSVKLFFHKIYRWFKHAVYADNEQIWASCILLQNTSNNVKDVRCANFDFRVTIEHHYSCDSFFGVTIRWNYLLHLPSVYGFKCVGEISE